MLTGMTACPKCGQKNCEGEPICGLRYIARSPKQEHGGFAATAKAAIREIYRLRRRCAHQDHYFADNALRVIDLEEKLAAFGGGVGGRAGHWR